MTFVIVTTKWLGRTKVYEVDRDNERTWIATFRLRGDAMLFAERQGATVIFVGEK